MHAYALPGANKFFQLRADAVPMTPMAADRSRRAAAEEQVAEEQVALTATDEEAARVQQPNTAPPAGYHKRPNAAMRCYNRWFRPPPRYEQPMMPLRTQLLDAAQAFSVIFLQLLFYTLLLVGADYVAHQMGILEGALLGNELKSTLKYYWTGVFATESSDLASEADSYAMHMQLRPGMTICEMGSADGTLMALVGRHVMPGGKLIATAPNRAELAATSAAVAAAGLGKVQTHKATSSDWAPGLPPHTCDAIYSRMVIHMVSESTIHTYIPQWAAALKPGGRMFMTDHNPLDGGTTGPKRPIDWKFGIIPLMWVLPQETEVAQILEGGFQLQDGPFEHPYFAGGYGAVYGPATQPTSAAKSP